MRTLISVSVEIACLLTALLSLVLLITAPDEWLLPGILHAAGAIAWFVIAMLLEQHRREAVQ